MSLSDEMASRLPIVVSATYEIDASEHDTIRSKLNLVLPRAPILQRSSQIKTRLLTSVIQIVSSGYSRHGTYLETV